MRVTPEGPRQAAIAIVGEAPGAEEERTGRPFVGASGHELTKMLHDAGIERSSCYITNLCLDRPASNNIEQWILKKKKGPADYIPYRGRLVAPFIPQEHERLLAELNAVKPNIVLALGNTALWALCKEQGVSKWRGSTLESDTIPGLKVLPALHPAAILRQWSDRYITVQDFRRVKAQCHTPAIAKNTYDFTTGPSYDTTRLYLLSLIAQLAQGPLKLVFDLEIFRKEILCMGLSTGPRQAFCIPFLCLKGYYFSEEEHCQVIELLRVIFTHPNLRLCNQNISFDLQFLFWRFFIKAKASFDTMVAQGVLFPGTPKALDYLASMYCENYLYWKDDGKFWIKYESDEKIWYYNCLDCAYTFEVWEAQEQAIGKLGFHPQMSFMMRQFSHVQDIMLRGVRVNTEAKSTIAQELWTIEKMLHKEIEFLTGKDLKGAKGDLSSTQLITFFYQELRLPPILSREKRPTCDDEALKKIAKKEPWLRPLVERINMLRSYGTASDVARKRVDQDNRWRTSYNIVGTETFRYSSRENVFESGLNLQNLTSGKDITDD